MSGRPSSDYTRCPDCGRRTVLFKYGRGGHDYLMCTRIVGTKGKGACRWECYRWPDTDSDRRELARWKQANNINDSDEQAPAGAGEDK